MIRHVRVHADTGRIEAISDCYGCGDGEFLYDFPEDFDITHAHAYRLEGLDDTGTVQGGIRVFTGTLAPLEVQKTAPVLTLEERNRADILYIAMMTGVQLDE
jgi:hypothetical protein